MCASINLYAYFYSLFTTNPAPHDTITFMKVKLNTEKEIIQEVDSMFQFVIMISIFFLTFIDNLFKLANETSVLSGKVQMQWTNVLISLVISYVLFKIFRHKLSEKFIKLINILLFAQVVSVISAIIVVLKYQNQITSYIGYFTLKGSLYASILISFMILLLLPLNAFSLKINRFFNKNSVSKLFQE